MRQCFTLPSLTQVWVYTRAEAEHVRYPTWGDALRGAETRPVTSDTLGVRIVGAASGLSSSRWPPRAWHPAGALRHRPDVRALTRRDALRAAETHSITPDMLGAAAPNTLVGRVVYRSPILIDAFFARPMALCAPQCVERLRPDRGHGGHARSSPTQWACDGDSGSRGAPGGPQNPRCKKFTTTLTHVKSQKPSLNASKW